MTHASDPGDTPAVLVTGGARFVGSHVAKGLRVGGYRTRIHGDLGVPARPDLEAIVADAWQGHASHPLGFRRA